MRPALACLALVLLALPGCAAAPKAQTKGWPAAGLCVAPWERNAACIPVSPADAQTIQRLIIAYVDAAHDPDYQAAKTLAQRPITETAIGGFLLYGYHYVDFSGDVLRAAAVASHEHGAEHGFRVTLGQAASGWVVLRFEYYDEPDPQLD